MNKGVYVTTAMGPQGPDLDVLEQVYQDLHAHPELAMAEQRTAAIAAEHVRTAGFEVTTGVGVTGVVGVLRRGEGPTVMLRADMDGLPVKEETGLPYASTHVVDGEIPTMHACGHDMHVAALIGATQKLAADPSWRGTVVAVFQPAEETGEGARAMIADGLFERFPRPDVVLGQHVTPLPAGTLGAHPGPAFAAADSITITVHGLGGHGSQPERSVDPILLTAQIITRLHTLIGREVSAFETAVLTVGQVNAGTAPNIIPNSATIGLTLRTYDPAVRETILASLRRIIAGESQAAGAPRSPDMQIVQSFPVLINDPQATARLNSRFEDLPSVTVIDPGPLTGSEDVGIFSDTAGVPGVYWLLGGSDPDLFEQTPDALNSLPSNHSPLYVPVIQPTLQVGIDALWLAATEWLEKSEPGDGLN